MSGRLGSGTGVPPVGAAEDHGRDARATVDPPHIFTLTGNLLAERTLEFDSWAPGRTQRARRESFQVGGKGINVSKMLNRLQTPNTALCFTGGATGAECESWLAASEFAWRAFPTTSPTRAGTVVRGANTDGIVQPETTFLGPDAAPDANAVRACAEFLELQSDGQILALCGSFPEWTDARFEPLRAVLERWLVRGQLIADTYGPPLAWASSRALSLIKINADELRSLSVAAHETPLPSSPRAWVVTDGPRAIRVRDEMGITDLLTPPVMREVSPTGSGDVLLAVILYALAVRKLRLRDAVAFAIPYAAANAAHAGVAEFPLPEGNER